MARHNASCSPIPPLPHIPPIPPISTLPTLRFSSSSLPPFFQLRFLDDSRGPEETGDRFLGIDHLLVMDIAVIASLNDQPITGAVNIYQPFFIDLRVFSDALISLLHDRRISAFVQQSKFDSSLNRVSEHRAPRSVRPIVGCTALVHHLKPTATFGVLGSFKAAGQTPEDVLHFGPLGMVLRQIGQRLNRDQRIPTESFAPNFGREPSLLSGRDAFHHVPDFLPRPARVAARGFRPFGYLLPVARFINPVEIKPGIAPLRAPRIDGDLPGGFIPTVLTVPDGFAVARQEHLPHEDAVNPHLPRQRPRMPEAAIVVARVIN